MKKVVLLASSLLAVAFLQLANADTKAEIKLIAPMEEVRGWCVDLFAHLTGGLPIGGFQGHNCFLYMGNGPTEDQGFYIESYEAKQELRLWHFDKCMTLNDPNPGSFVATEDCTGAEAQKFDWKADGQIVPLAAPSLCLTLGDRVVTGGGGDPIHLIRRLSFETCDAEVAMRQQWEWRTEYEESIPTMPRKYN
jgi:hypothetical protein